jgi:pyridoxamine 5'-phosphate oxidase
MANLMAGLRKEYLCSSIDEKNVDKDPLKQFEKWFLEAMDAKIDEPNAMVLSTSDPDGNVSGRVVLLKEIAKNGFIFFTNYDSRKGRQIDLNPRAALTFLWYPIERQIRVEGKIIKIARKESEKYFSNRPLESQVSACVSPQSSVVPDRAFLESMREGFILDLNNRPPGCPENWGGYLLKPTLVEFWQGREHRMHDRLQYRQIRNKWIIERLAP